VVDSEAMSQDFSELMQPVTTMTMAMVFRVMALEQ
jgi:hypothetical protein